MKKIIIRPSASYIGNKKVSRTTALKYAKKHNIPAYNSYTGKYIHNKRKKKKTILGNRGYAYNVKMPKLSVYSHIGL